MMGIVDRYSDAVHSSNLKSKPDTTQSDTDVLGAASWASKPVRTVAGVEVRGSPLGIALMRLFAGDNTGTGDLVRVMARALIGKAWHSSKLVLPEVEATDIARAVLAWYRDGVCKVCGGHGKEKLVGAPGLSDRNCRACKGTGKVEFNDAFTLEQLYLARWMLAEVDREQAIAGPAAMAALAPRLEL